MIGANLELLALAVTVLFVASVLAASLAALRAASTVSVRASASGLLCGGQVRGLATG